MNDNFASNLKILRMKKCLKQSTLANMVGVSHGTISNWESGAGEPTVTTLIKLSEVLDCSLERLAGISHKPPVVEKYYIQYPLSGYVTGYVYAESNRHAIELAKRGQIDVLNDATIAYEYDCEKVKLILGDKQYENSN